MKAIYQRLVQAVQSFTKDDRGVTAIEYGLIAAATAVAIIFALTGIKSGLSATFQSIVTAI